MAWIGARAALDHALGQDRKALVVDQLGQDVDVRRAVSLRSATASASRILGMAPGPTFDELL